MIVVSRVPCGRYMLIQRAKVGCRAGASMSTTLRVPMCLEKRSTCMPPTRHLLSRRLVLCSMCIFLTIHTHIARECSLLPVYYTFIPILCMSVCMYGIYICYVLCVSVCVCIPVWLRSCICTYFLCLCTYMHIYSWAFMCLSICMHRSSGEGASRWIPTSSCLRQDWMDALLMTASP